MQNNYTQKQQVYKIVILKFRTFGYYIHRFINFLSLRITMDNTAFLLSEIKKYLKTRYTAFLNLQTQMGAVYNRIILITFVLSMILPFSQVAVAEHEQSFVYDDHGKRDPFLRLIDQNGVMINPEKELLTSDMKLEGIITDKTGNNVAIINGNVVKVNDKIGSFVITSIQPDAVILIKGEERVVLKLKKED